MGPREALLERLGRAVRARRQDRGLTLRGLAGRARVSERFLAELEAGRGNISVVRLRDVAEALGTCASALLGVAEATERRAGVVSLLGLRGAGKSAVGKQLAERLGVPFVELDARIEQAAGMTLATIFELHGDAYYRRLEREALARALSELESAVLATGGSLVTDPETYEIVRTRTTSVWLKAGTREHWDRVVAQGDVRPMAHRANAMAELDALWKARAPLYALAALTVDTAGRSVDAVAEELVEALGRG